MDIYDYLLTLTLPITSVATFASVASLFVVISALHVRRLWQRNIRRASRKPKELRTDCPFEYILNIYGRNHFAALVRKLAPDLEVNDPRKWQMILEIMDGVHFCLILIDDVVPSESS